MTAARQPCPTPPQNAREQVKDFLLQFQNKLTSTLEAIDSQKTFLEDRWQRETLGNGITRVIQDGQVFEQGGVNFSEVHGKQLPASLLQHHPQLENQPFWAAGVSLVLHPINPHCPTVHLNYRYFESGNLWWFGGGSDLTPYYAYKEDCQHWHRTIKQAMDRFDPNFYPAFSFWCDEYFYNHHRNECRGIGGTFYDYLNTNSQLLIPNDTALKSADKQHSAFGLQTKPHSWETLFAFQQSNANAFFDAYLPICQQRCQLEWTEDQRQFQLYRRGRYVEFNLLHDRGTLFGIQSNGRIESILMSLPPLVRWEYNYTPKAGSPEALLTTDYLVRYQNWV